MNLNDQLVIVLLSVISLFNLGLDICVYKIKKADEEQLHNSGFLIHDLKELPFYCDDLSLSPDEDYVTFNTRKKLFEVSLHESRYICKFKNLTEPLQKVVERISRFRLASGLQGERYLQCGNTSLREPSDHLSAAFRKVLRNTTFTENVTYTVIHWDIQPEVSFVSKDVKYDQGQIKVSENRFYFIYSSVLINLTNTLVNIGKIYRFSLFICANRNGYERTLLSTYKIYNASSRNDVDGYYATSVSLRSNVFITKEDSLYVKVSDQNSLNHDSVGNTFGIMPMG